MADYYKILEVNRNASQEEIQKAFRKLALKYHPDKQQGKSKEEVDSATKKFQEINEAYSVLSDPKKRQEYDTFGTVNGNGDGFSGFENMDDMENLFKHMHGGGFGMGDIFEHMHGGSGFGFNTRQNVKGSDVNIRIECTLEDSYNGAKKTYKYNRQVKCHHCNGTGSKDGVAETCPHCNGTGMIMNRQQRSPWQYVEQITPCPYCNGTGKTISKPCNHCKGTGLETISETLQIEIPKGVSSGERMAIPGMGNMPANGEGTPGDLIVMFVLKKHDIFVPLPNSYDLGCKTSVGVIDCILGCEKEISCIDGSKVRIKIPQGTKHNDKIVLDNKGMPIENGKHYGDLVVFIDQVMPKTISKDETKILENLKTSKNFKK